VRDPYIPLLAVTVEQVEELAYGALYVIVTEGPDADMFDATLERIIRIDEHGRADGKAVPLSNSPGARDGARTTFQGFDEPHRLYLPRAVAAHETMVANLEKRSLEDPWGLYVGTAGELGQGSIAEGLHAEAEMIARGEIDDPQLFYIHRWTPAGPRRDREVARPGSRARRRDHRGDRPDRRVRPGPVPLDRAAVGPADRRQELPRAGVAEPVDKSSAQAFDAIRWAEELARPIRSQAGAFVTAGFDGARFRDSTGSC
jgi:hypothetical protein